MSPDQFFPATCGEVVRHVNGYYAFVPHDPPSTVDYNTIAAELSAADAALSELSGLGRYVPNPNLLIRPYIQREAVASSRMEGTQADLTDLLIEDLDEKRPRTTDAYEIRNYIAALDEGIAALAVRPVAGRLVRDIHRTLLDEVRGKERLPGEFRKSQNWIRGSGPGDAFYVPPPPERLADCVSVWERFVNDRGPMPDLVRCAIAHEYFETIHPFLDGNGRIGRLLIALMLIERGRLSKPLLYVSSYIEQTKIEYYERLQAVRTHGDRIGWIKYFLKAVEVSARDAVRRTDRLLALRGEWIERPDLKGQHRARHLIDELFVNPYVTIARAAHVLAVSDVTAGKAISQLQQVGLLREASGKSWGRYWAADAVLHAIKDPLP